CSSRGRSRSFGVQRLPRGPGGCARSFALKPRCSMRSKLCVLWFLSPVWLIGCTGNAPPPKPETDTDSPQQVAVRQEFNRLKAALAALREANKGADVVWELLGPESQAAAEQQAKVLR